MPWFYFTYSCGHPGRVLAETFPVGRVVGKCEGCNVRKKAVPLMVRVKPLALPKLTPN